MGLTVENTAGTAAKAIFIRKAFSMQQLVAARSGQRVFKDVCRPRNAANEMSKVEKHQEAAAIVALKHVSISIEAARRDKPVLLSLAVGLRCLRCQQEDESHPGASDILQHTWQSRCTVNRVHKAFTWGTRALATVFMALHSDVS